MRGGRFGDTRLLFVVTAFFIGGVESQAAWNIEPVDLSGEVGWSLSIDTDPAGNPHAAYFTFTYGSTVNISDGLVAGIGAMSGSVVNITGGRVDGFHAHRGSIVNLSGGSVGSIGASGGTVNISGGTIRGLNAQVNSVVTVTGGEFIDYFLADSDSGIHISDGTFGGTFEADGDDIHISGGIFDAHFVARSGSGVSMSGGRLNGQFDANPGSSISFFGSRFILGGQDITRTLMQNVPFTITARDVPFYALLADGSPLSIDLNSRANIGSDSFYPNAALTVTLFLPGDYNVDGVVDTGDLLVWRKTLGATLAARGSGADGNFDGQVTEADYDVWRAQLGQTLFGTIPEPSTICAAIVGWLALMCATWRYRSNQVRC